MHLQSFNQSPYLHPVKWYFWSKRELFCLFWHSLLLKQLIQSTCVIVCCYTHLISDLCSLYFHASVLAKTVFLYSWKKYFSCCAPPPPISDSSDVCSRVWCGLCCCSDDNWQTRSTFNTHQFILLQARLLPI